MVPGLVVESELMKLFDFPPKQPTVFVNPQPLGIFLLFDSIVMLRNLTVCGCACHNIFSIRWR